jgi:hypothetical protein
MQYQEYRSALEDFDSQYPEEKAGYNAILKITRRAYQRAKAVGVAELDPLPEKK